MGQKACEVAVAVAGPLLPGPSPLDQKRRLGQGLSPPPRVRGWALPAALPLVAGSPWSPLSGCIEEVLSRILELIFEILGYVMAPRSLPIAI